MKLRFRVRRRAADGEPGGGVSAALILVPCPPNGPNDPNYLAWRGMRPVGEVQLSFLDPHLVEQFEPNTEVTIAIRRRSNDDDSS